MLYISYGNVVAAHLAGQYDVNQKCLINSEQEAEVMKANPWLYHYYAVQSKLHYGLAYEAATRMYGPPPPDIQVYPPAMQYTPAPPVCINGNQVAMMANAALQTHLPHVPPHLGTPMHYAYERLENGPVDYSVTLQENRYHNLKLQAIPSSIPYIRNPKKNHIPTQHTYFPQFLFVSFRCTAVRNATCLTLDSNFRYHNIRIEDTRIQPNAKRKGKNSEEKPSIPISNMSPRGTPSTITSGGDTLVAVSAGSIASRRPGSKIFNIAETDMVDQWNPSPTWSESALQKVPDVCHQDLSPYVTTTPPTPSGTPSAYTHNYSHTFVFDWSPEQYVPHTNNRCNTVTTESSYQQTWNRSQRTSFANSAENSVPATELPANCNPNRLSLQMRVSNPPPAYNAAREGEILRRQIGK